MILKTINNIYDTDIGYSFFNSKIAIISSSIFLIIFLCSAFAEIVAPYNPFDPMNISLMDAFIPPIWSEGGTSNFLLGTDQQGRDMLSTMIFGARISLIVGFLLVIVFMIFKYRFFGVVANLSLISNLLMLVGISTLLEATLTLPGIAGIILTVGMAVDANVLIFERIKEELHKENSNIWIQEILKKTKYKIIENEKSIEKNDVLIIVDSSPEKKTKLYNRSRSS